MKRSVEYLLAVCVVFIAFHEANLTDTSKNGKCVPSVVYKEVTLKGGINAGTYKDVGGVTTMEDCQSKCCEFPACDLAFMLAGSCYLVGCYDQKNCAMQPAKESKFQPQISYVTRWNAEGVKHTVLLQEKGVQYVCPKMQPLMKVTLKDGLQAGDFTDVGKVSNLGQCYDVCCQQEKCDLAFMLGQNCFSVQCKDKTMCVTTPAQPSIFNPQIAYILKRNREEITPKSAIEKLSNNQTAICPKTNILDKMTLKGGVDAGVYKDHGIVKNMDLCRRICCEMTECHLAFMLGENCFSVKCASVDSCRALKAKPSSYYPKISYLRNVVTNQLLPSLDGKSSSAMNNSIEASSVVHGDGSKKVTTSSKKVNIPKPSEQLKPNSLPLHVGVTETPVIKNVAPGSTELSKMQADSTTAGYAITPNGLKPMKIDSATVKDVLNKGKDAGANEVAVKDSVNPPNPPKTPAKDTNAVGKSDIPIDDNKLLLNALEANDNANVSADCKPGILKSNVTLKGGRKAGEFIEIKGLSDMKSCVKRCCDDLFKKCNLAFMLGDTCYSVACKQKELCATIPAPPTKFNPLVQYVRGLEEEAVQGGKVPDPSKSVDIPKADSPKPADAAKTDVTKLTDESASAHKEGDSSKDSDISKNNDVVPAKESTPPEHPAAEETKDAKDSDKSKAAESSSDKEKEKKKKSCISQPIVTGKSIQGGKKAGKFKIFREIKDMGTCINKCCSLKKQCDVAYMEDNKCFSILCFKKSACSAIDLRDSDVNPRFAYMDHYLEKVEEEEAEGELTTELEAEDNACLNVEITKNKTLKGGTRAGKFHSMGKKDMKKCISECCGRPNCDIAYQLNGHCYSVECSDGKLCQATNEPSKEGDNIQLAYMNKNGLNEKQRDYMVIYIIVGSLAFAATLGGLIWLVFAISKRKKMKKPPHKRLLDDEEEEEPIDDLLQKRPSRTRYRQPRN